MALYYLELLKNPLNFPPVSRDVNVFFDECQKQVFAVATEKNKTRVHVKGPNDASDANFLLQEKGNVISIKFSPDQRILAVQRSSKSIDFINFYAGASTEEYSQSCKGRSTQIIGFCWTGLNDIVFVTNQGIEFYQAQGEKCSLKLLKHYNATVNWFVFLPESSVLLLSSGIMGNIIHPYLFKTGNIMRLPKFEVENPPSTRNPQPGSLLERDVTVANIYNNIYVVVLRNQPRSFNAVGAEIVLYQLQKDTPAKKTAVLRLGAVGRFAVNVVDNLVAVHHQASKTSMIFDINCPGEFDGQVTQYYPVLSPLPIEPYMMQVKLNEHTENGEGETREVVCESYSPNWVVFQPNIIIDAKLGCLWKLNVKLSYMINMIEDKGKLIDFLLLRSGSKPVIISVCNEVLTPGRQTSLGNVALIFDKINAVYAEYLELNSTGTASVQDTTKENELTGHWFQKQSVLDQHDMYAAVFASFVDQEQVSHKFVVAVLIEYLRSLSHHKIPVEYYLNEFIINLLVKKKLFYQLHQFIQYHVLSDSKSLACLLLSLEQVYPPAYDLALDMMKRLGTAQEEIIETLLLKGVIVSALKQLQNFDMIDSAAPRKFLAAAMKTGDDMLFYTVFTFFQQRNIKLRKNPKFVRGEQCEIYQKHFENVFGRGTRKDMDGLIESLGHLDMV
ncbi:regulator of MON1-CCZ1 complex-like [Hydractinia symbiolongicarpus]|uniref:regulator of MON1-CCZ1 complex-like n=1 Tax=Hydractinia symbiolongicarpus TaxID=13093 RepID=UPI0025512FD5|nr:regulator of MON1-CCZ1 complex-like [Hydractinia symbiolongicarpus]